MNGMEEQHQENSVPTPVTPGPEDDILATAVANEAGVPAVESGASIKGLNEEDLVHMSTSELIETFRCKLDYLTVLAGLWKNKTDTGELELPLPPWAETILDLNEEYAKITGTEEEKVQQSMLLARLVAHFLKESE
jgi:hypothetical protein